MTEREAALVRAYTQPGDALAAIRLGVHFEIAQFHARCELARSLPPAGFPAQYNYAVRLVVS